MAKERVKLRVLAGGHNIEPDIISRRYLSGVKNLFNIYMGICEEVLIFDNSDGNNELIAEKIIENDIKIINQKKFSKLVELKK